MTVKKSSDLKSTINEDLADNNSGSIGAAELRNNMVDIVDSIVPIVASGDFQTYPFNNNPVNFVDLIIAKSGVKFDTPETAGDAEANKIQRIPYPGVSGLDHNSLDNLAAGDVHTQYLACSGVRRMTGNFGLGEEWINNSGESTGLETNNHGFHFSMTNPDTGKYGEIVHVGSGNSGGVVDTYTKFKFDYDLSNLHTAKSTALAWISFNGSAYLNGSLSDSGLSGVVVSNSYNVSSIASSGAGTYQIHFKDGLLGAGNTNYAVIAHSNGTTSASSAQSMDLVTAAVVQRDEDYFSLAIRNDNGEFINCRRNDVVVFGLESGVRPEASINVTNFT